MLKSATGMLTADVDSGAEFTGGAGDDEFTGTLTVAGTQTLNTYDRLDGGDGTDTLKATLVNVAGGSGDFAAGSGDLATVAQNFESFYLRPLNTQQVDFTGINAEEIWMDRAQANLTAVAVGSPVALGIVDGDGNDTFTANYAANVVTDALDNDDVFTQTIALEDADATLTINSGGFATASGGTALALDLTGENTLVLNGNIATSGGLDTITSTGEGSVDLDVSAQVSSGDWDVTLGAGDDKLTIVGASGGAAFLDGDDSIDLGEGDDVLALTGLQASGDLNALDLSGVSNVEGLELVGQAIVGSGAGVDSDQTLSLEDFDNLTFAVDANGSGGLSQQASGDSLTLDTTASDFTLTFEGDSGGADTTFQSAFGGNSGDGGIVLSEEVGSLTLNSEGSAVGSGGATITADLTNAAAADDSSTESLTSLTLADTTDASAAGFVSGDAANFDIGVYDVNGMTSIDLSGIAGTDANGDDYATSFTLDASLAGFAAPVTVSVGDGDTTYINDSNDKREIFQFSGEDIGDVLIGSDGGTTVATGNAGTDTEFTITSAGNGDKLDFSAFANVSSLDDLAITGGDGTTDFVVSAAADQFEGSITLVGTADVEQSVFESNGFIF